MSSKVSYIITDNNVTVNYDGETHIVKRSDGLADRLIRAVKENRLNEIPALVSTAKRIEVLSKGAFVVRAGRVQVNGVDAPQVLSDKIVRFSNDGLPFKPLLKFAEKLQANPSFRAVNELFSFLEKNDHPLTETGNFLAYKRVRSDFKDIHSGTFDNSVGNTCEVPRNMVDEDCNRTCSNGLHVASWHYAHTQFASSNPETDVMLEVEINPADVVAVPVDYQNSKMRVCKYKVLGVVTTPYEPSEALRVLDTENYPEDDVCCVECGDTECFGECLDDCCDLCFETDCYGECADKKDEYPYDDELDDPIF